MSKSFDRQALLDRKVELEMSLQKVRDEFQRLAGAIQLIDAFIAELDAPKELESEENNDRIKS